MPIPISGDDPLSIFPHISHLRMATIKGPVGCLTPTGTNGPLTAMTPNYADSGRNGTPVPHQFTGGLKSGFHAMPAIGEEALIAYQPKLVPTASIGATSTPQLLDVLGAGESLQRHPDGRVLNYLQNSGTTTLVNDPVAGVTMTLTRSPDTVALAGAEFVADSFGTTGDSNKLTGIMVFTNTVTITLTATTFTAPTLNAGSFTPASATFPTLVTSAGSPVFYGLSFNVSTAFFAASFSGGPTTAGFSTQTGGATGIALSATSFSGGSVTSWGSLSGGSVSIGRGTLISGWACAGVNVGDFLSVSIPALDASHPEVTYKAAVTATNTVSVYYINAGTATVSLSGAAIKLLVFQAS